MVVSCCLCVVSCWLFGLLLLFVVGCCLFVCCLLLCWLKACFMLHLSFSNQEILHSMIVFPGAQCFGFAAFVCYICCFSNLSCLMSVLWKQRLCYLVALLFGCCRCLPVPFVRVIAVHCFDMMFIWKERRQETNNNDNNNKQNCNKTTAITVTKITITTITTTKRIKDHKTKPKKKQIHERSASACNWT